MSLENSADKTTDPSASVPLAAPGEETPGEVAGKPETRQKKALNALKEAEAEGNKADTQGNKADGKTKKAETKTPPSLRSTNIPGEAVVVTIVPKQFTKSTTKLWSAMKATIAERAVKVLKKAEPKGNPALRSTTIPSE